MKYIFSLILTIILFTACSNLNLTPELSVSKDKKQMLIKQANSGNVDAMLQLNKIYLFPQTKEGLELYTKWINKVLEDGNYEEIMSFLEVYKKHINLFVNGRQNYIKLLQRAASFGKKEPLYILVDDSIKNAKNYTSYEKLILKDANQDDLIKLYDVYNAKYKTKEAYKIRDIMSSKGFKPNLNTKYSILQSLLKQRNQEKKIQMILEDILSSSEYDIVLKTAKLMKKRRKYDQALSFYKRAVELKNKDAKSYFEIALMYKKKRFYEENFVFKKYEKQIKENLEKAALLDDFKAAKELLKNDFYEKKSKENFKRLEKELLTLNEAKRALAYIYENNFRDRKEQAYKILDELASNKNEKALIYLATKTNIRKNPMLAKLIFKWQEFILNSNNPRLMQKASKLIHIYKYARFKNLKDFKDKLTKKELENKNIYTLRSLYEKYKDKDEQKANFYINEAINAGDAYSTNLLIKKYRRENSH